MKRPIVIAVILALLSAGGLCRAEEEHILYTTTKADNVTCDIGVLMRTGPEATEIEVSALARGQGSNFRKWEVADVKLDVGSRTLRPADSRWFFVRKESFMRLPAAVLFAAIGTQYEVYGEKAVSGQPCRVTGAGQQPSRGGVASAIDKAGMAVGLGLLASQAHGDLTGTVAVFKPDQETARRIDGEHDRVRILLENKSTREKERIQVDLPAAFVSFVEQHPGIGHAAGVPKGGTFITVDEPSPAPQGAGKPADAPQR